MQRPDDEGVELPRLQAGAFHFKDVPPERPEIRFSHLASGGVVHAEAKNADHWASRIHGSSEVLGFRESSLGIFRPLDGVELLG